VARGRKRSSSEAGGAAPDSIAPPALRRHSSSGGGGTAPKGPVGGGLKASSESSAIDWLLRHWNTDGDVAVKYALSTASLAELQQVIDNGFTPNLDDAKRAVAEQVNNYLIQQRENLGPGGGALDPVNIFRWRWNVDQDKDALLRGLTHKDLRRVLKEYNGNRALEEVAEEAAAKPPIEAVMASVAPDDVGCTTMGRIVRMEITDPFGDALVLGDANLSFSKLLAEHRKALGHHGGMIATTFESLEQLRERYEEINQTIEELQTHGCEVWHEVDCTRLALDDRFQGLEERFSAVYYNFPHAGAVRGFFDAHPFVRWRHENLMQFFFRALRAFVKPGGSVKVSSNERAMGVRYSDVLRAATLNEFVHIETFPFQQWQLRRYNRSFGDKRDARKRLEGESSYTAQRAEKDMVYAFTYAPSGGVPARAQIKKPPACSDLLAATSACRCGFISPVQMQNTDDIKRFHFKASGPHQQLEGKEKSLCVAELYKRFLSEISGQHVG